MGSLIKIQAVCGRLEQETVQRSLEHALDDFDDVDRCCTRFSADSPLMRANAAADRWCSVGATCFEALVAAYDAHRESEGKFDPRVHDDLVRLGYDRSMSAGGISARSTDALSQRAPMPRWEPDFRVSDRSVRIGPHAVDLGGIGKGLAVRRAARRLDQLGVSYLIDAGGDCWCRGHAPDGDPWRLAVEDPAGGTEPVAVLALTDLGVATSSTRLAHWQIEATTVHHLIDPATGQPGGPGLAAVTVVADDTAAAEVWSKALFLEGLTGIAAAARRRGLAALWVDDQGQLTATPEITPLVVWRSR